MDSPFLAFFFFAVIVGAVLVIAYTNRERRKRFFFAAGAEMGFAPAEEESLVIDEIPLINRDNGGFRTIMQGTAGGYAAWLFDYGYMRGRSRIMQTVIAFNSPGMNLPPFELRPRAFLDSLAAELTNSIVEFPMTNSFTDRFVVVGSNSEAILRLFKQQLQSYVEKLPETGWTIEGCNDTLALYRRRNLASDLLEFVGEASAVAKGFLGFVRT